MSVLKSLVLWGSALFFASVVAAEPYIFLEDSYDRYTVKKPLPTLLDDGYGPADVLLSQQFSNLHYEQSLNEGPQTYWHRLHISAAQELQEKGDYYLVAKNPVLQQLTFYLYDESGALIQQRQAGVRQRQPGDEVDLDPVLQFSATPGQKLTVLIKKQSDGPAVMPLVVYSQESMYEYRSKRYVMIGGVALFLVVIALFNSFVGILIRSQTYIWYLAFYVLTFLELSVLMGFGQYIWPFSMQIWLATHMLVINFLLLLTAFLFGSQFLVARLYASGYYKYRALIISLLLMGAMSALFVPEYYLLQPFIVAQVWGSLFILGMSLTAYRNGFLPARFFLLSWVCLLIGAGVGMGSYKNLLPFNDITRHGLALGALAELSILSFALVDRQFFTERKGIKTAYTDPQTGLPNYSFFRNRFAEAVENSMGHGDQLWVIMLRITGVESFTGLLGPDASSKVYRQLVDRFNKYLEASPWSIPVELPYGGKTYLISLPGNQMLLMADSRSDPNEFIEAFLQRAEKPVRVGAMESSLSLQAGLTLYQMDKFTLQEAYRKAQLALNDCELHRTRWSRYDPQSDQVSKERLHLLEDLREAIVHRDLTCQLQPQFDMDKALIGAEALVRWNHVNKGFISPAVFVPLAEQSSLVFFITRIMIEKVCSWLSKTKVPDGFHVSVNLSLLDLLEPELLGFIETCLVRYNIQPCQLVFEVTETAAMEDDANFVATIEGLHRMGFRVALDDFGTGYSSLVYMQRMKPDIVKVDMGFVQNIHESEINRKIVRAIVQIAHATKATTIAEGVELEEEMLLLGRLGVDFVQGYLMGKPVPINEFSGLFFEEQEST
ncbi:EAL domain-containing protein [Candidatus Pelagadaptatus aseana]|uniref:EAL domain-containing protein n=1 Tax=Candidatus Pelagadaptatus aseana TaxID=3120508 RepID=UPI003C6ED688